MNQLLRNGVEINNNNNKEYEADLERNRRGKLLIIKVGRFSDSQYLDKLYTNRKLHEFYLLALT